MARNIEVKFRVSDLPSCQTKARKIATDALGIQRQVDTYFRCAQGRLKLREIDCEGQLASQLIWYDRADIQKPRASDYQITTVAEPAALAAILAHALGIAAQVRKTREVLLYHNVRIHLDAVEGLGHFVEFEAVLGDGIEDGDGVAQVAHLQEQLQLADKDQIANSYMELANLEKR